MGFFAKLLGLSDDRPRPVHLTDDNFREEVYQSDLPVIVDVWSSTCAPCKKLEPIIMDLAKDYDGRVKVCEANPQEAPRSLGQLQIRGTPTVLCFQKGKELERVVGFRGSLYFEETIEELFGIPRKPA